ncbi:uncharacterized protein LOC130693398 [Daphnia carinata]|uniref:uncharacterized protein LOC130693398 n=1 Tax=Daphnia carinata TaxID=120202 RepID=UPI00257D2C2B|nr:uncharacterized protein LOC130693398 [Daphnia carinata]
MRRHFYTMLLGAFVLVSAFAEADSFNSSGGEAETMIEEETQTLVAGEGTQSEATEDPTAFFGGESAGRSSAGTGEGTFLASDEPSPTETDGQVDTNIPAEETQPSVGEDSVIETDPPALEIQPKTDVDQEPTVSLSPEDVGFFAMIRSLFSVFAESVSPSPVEVNSQPPRTVGRYFVSHDSDEGSFEDDNPDEMPPLMPVRLARIKQFVRANAATGRVRTSSDEQEDHPFVIEATRQHVLGRSPTTAPSSRSGRVITYSDEHDDHSYEQDVSLEVDVSLLPEIRRFLEPNIGHGELISHYEESDGRGTREILGNPMFQQKVQEIDSRLKRASGANGQRLMEKYAEALAVYSTSSLNMASTSATVSCFLPFFITCLLARIS